MAYETGTATGIRDLLNKLEVFAKTKGWNAFWESDVLYCDKDGHYVGIECADSINTDILSGNREHFPLIRARCFTGHIANESISKQPGFVTNPAKTNGFYAPFVKYEFFAGELYIHVVVEVNAGLFNHFGFGVHEKAFSYAGGAYVYGVSWAMHYTSYSSERNEVGKESHQIPFEQGVQVVYNGNCYNTRRLGRGALGGYFREWRYRFLPTQIFKDTPNEINGVSPLLPIVNAIVPPPHTGTYILGRVPDMRAVKMDTLRPSDVVKLGQDEWVCYPIKRRALETVPFDEVSSGTYGIAYKKVL